MQFVCKRCQIVVQASSLLSLGYLGVTKDDRTSITESSKNLEFRVIGNMSC